MRRARCGLLLCALTIGRAEASESPTSAPLTPKQSSEAAERALNAPEFGTTVKVQRYRLRWSEEPKQRPPTAIDSDAVARTLRIGMILLGLAALVTIVIALARSRVRRTARSSAPSAPLPTTVLGLDVRPDSLPEDIAAEVRRLWESGEVVAALSVLYRATLADLIHRRGVSFAVSATERECVEIASSSLSATAAAYFRQLTYAWQRAAYGRRFPDREQLGLFVDGYMREIAGSDE
jgi:hypothetical protein